MSGDERADESLELDPFSGHVAFASSMAGARATALARLDAIRPLDPLDTTIDKLVDLEALEALASFGGLLRLPRTRASEELDDDITEALGECKAQFHLRNLGRAERFVDLDEPLPLEPVERESGLPGASESTESLMARLPSALITSTSVAAVREFQGDRRSLFEETAWNEHFSKEIKADATGPLWAPSQDDAAGDEP